MSVYFLGIGGIGMSALARYFLQRGKSVHGYDRTPSAITQQLQHEGAIIHFEEDITQIPADLEFVVYTPAVPQNHAEYVYLQHQNIPILKRAQVLGNLSNNLPTIAIAGTHGKTTTTAMTTQLLHTSKKLLAFIGGVTKNFDSNVLIQPNADTLVVEADEFDRSFLTLTPTLAVITSIDADHLDIYGDKQQLLNSFQLFADQITENGVLLIHEKVAAQVSHPHKLIYGTGNTCDFRISEVQLTPTNASFTLHYRNCSYPQLAIGITGMHNVLNAAAATAIALLQQLPEQEIRTHLQNFNGVKRRFDYQITRPNLIYIDDYAHHPEEIKATISAVKKLYPDKELTIIFQPHLYSRTRDFGSQFADVLSRADKVLLLDIYPARELPIAGITSQWLCSLITSPQKEVITKENLLTHLQQNPPQVLLTLGAGNIDQLVPKIRQFLILNS